MSGARLDVRRVPLPAVLVLLAGMGMVAIYPLPGFPRPFLWSFVVAAAMRLAMGRDGSRLAPRWVLQTIAWVLAVVCVGWLFSGAQKYSGIWPLVGLLSVLAAFQSLCLLMRLKPFGAFFVIVLSSTHAAGAAFLRKDVGALWTIVAYVAVLFWALILFERQASLELDDDEAESATRRVVVPNARPLPARILMRTLAVMLLAGFPIGMAIYYVAPRVGQIRHALDFEIDVADETYEDVEDRGPFGSRTMPSSFGMTGPSMTPSTVPYGSVAEIKKDQTALFEVKEFDPGTLAVKAATGDVYFRDHVIDLYRRDTLDWVPSGALKTKKRHSEPTAMGARGWFRLEERNAREGSVRLFRARMLLGGHSRLYLMPLALQVRVLREDASGKLVPYPLLHLHEHHNAMQQAYFHTASGTIETFRPDDVVEHISLPQPRRGPDLALHRSALDPEMPATYLQVPDASRDAFRRLALGVVGNETSPWLRAEALERWLKAPPFVYTLKVQEATGEDYLLEFLQRSRSGHCEVYAGAMVMLLRALGHPARYVTGFWGGDVLNDRKTILMRASHYHAWAELYLGEDVGWVPLNPTPPDRTPADATATEHEAAATEGKDTVDPQGRTSSFLEYGADDHAALWDGIGRFLDTVLVRPLRWLFSADGFFAGPFLLALGFFLLVGWNRNRQVRRVATSAGAKVPSGPYGKALLLLAKRGLRRRAAQTPREFGRIAIKLLPKIRAPLTQLTFLHERERFGATDPQGLRAAQREALDALRDGLKASDTKASS